MYFDGYDAIQRIAYKFYEDDWQGSPNASEDTYQDNYDKAMARKAIIDSRGLKVVEMWENECGV